MKWREANAAISFAVIMLAAACLFFSAAILPAQQPDAETAECLECHPYEDVIAATAGYVTKWDEKVNPHMYVDLRKENPHQGEKVISPCAYCHDSHELPFDGEVRRADLQYCYNPMCHHTEKFESCAGPNCHH